MGCGIAASCGSSLWESPQEKPRRKAVVDREFRLQRPGHMSFAFTRITVRSQNLFILPLLTSSSFDEFGHRGQPRWGSFRMHFNPLLKTSRTDLKRVGRQQAS